MPLPRQNNEAVATVESRRERIGINLGDVFRLPELMRSTLLAGKIDLASGAVNTDKSRLDEAAVVFCCDLLTAACTCDIVRGHDRRVGDYPTRVYIQRAQAWQKVSGSITLSVVEDGRAMLNPELFPRKPQAVKMRQVQPGAFL